MLKWGREWPQIAGLIARLADRPSEPTSGRSCAATARRSRLRRSARSTESPAPAPRVASGRRCGNVARSASRHGVPMPMRQFKLIAVSAVLIALACSAPRWHRVNRRGRTVAQVPQGGVPGDRVEFRSDGAMAQGKAPFDATEFSMRAGRVAALTRCSRNRIRRSRRRRRSKARRSCGPTGGFRREDEGPRRPQRGAREGPAGGDETRSKAAFFDAANHVQGLSRQVQGRLSQYSAIVASGAALTASASAPASSTTTTSASGRRNC